MSSLISEDLEDFSLDLIGFDQALVRGLFPVAREHEHFPLLHGDREAEAVLYAPPFNIIRYIGDGFTVDLDPVGDRIFCRRLSIRGY